MKTCPLQQKSCHISCHIFHENADYEVKKTVMKANYLKRQNPLFRLKNKEAAIAGRFLVWCGKQDLNLHEETLTRT